MPRYPVAVNLNEQQWNEFQKFVDSVESKPSNADIFMSGVKAETKSQERKDKEKK